MGCGDEFGGLRHPGGTPRGRGSHIRPDNRFDRFHLRVLDEHREEVRCEHGEGVRVPTRVIEDRTRSILNRVDVPDLPFHWTINPYRGCEHGCVYCYARPGHEHLGLSAGLDFETVIHAKRDAPALLARALAKEGWIGEQIVMSGVTDPYQPIERRLRITRGCLEVMDEYRQCVGIITKGRLVLRDLDILSSMASRRLVQVFVTLTTLDPALSARLEARASAPAVRLAMIRRLADAGVPVGVMTAPIIPGINDREIPALLEAARDAGARSAGFVLLRLPGSVEQVFREWLHRVFPDRAGHVLSLLRQCRGGSLNDPRLHHRFRGEGPIARQIAQTHRVFRERLGFSDRVVELDTDAFVRARRARAGVQRRLFED